MVAAEIWWAAALGNNALHFIITETFSGRQVGLDLVQQRMRAWGQRFGVNAERHQGREQENSKNCFIHLRC